MFILNVRTRRASISIREYTSKFSGDAVTRIQPASHPISSTGSNNVQLSPPLLELYQKVIFIPCATEVSGLLLDHGDDVIQGIV